MHYFTGYWGPSTFPPAVLVRLDGPSTLATAFESGGTEAVDRAQVYPSTNIATMVDDMQVAMVDHLATELEKFKRIGVDLALPLGSKADVRTESIGAKLLSMRRSKDDDEVAMIRRAVEACETAYAKARSIRRPGVTEVEVYAQMYAVVVESVGEPIGERGNDFRAGGLPRPRGVEAGELMPLDVSVQARGYNCDLCRTFPVDGNPTDAQCQAHLLVTKALQYIEHEARAGSSCKDIYHAISQMIDGKHRWSFFHHLGHGIGMSVHGPPALIRTGTTGFRSAMCLP